MRKTQWDEHDVTELLNLLTDLNSTCSLTLSIDILILINSITCCNQCIAWGKMVGLLHARTCVHSKAMIMKLSKKCVAHHSCASAVNLYTINSYIHFQPEIKGLYCTINGSDRHDWWNRHIIGLDSVVHIGIAIICGKTCMRLASLSRHAAVWLA